MAPRPGSIIPILTKKIHPPLPMTPRESQRLSNSLLQTFNNALDKEHGADKSTTTHTDMHMASILNSPHFAGSKHPGDTKRWKSKDRPRRLSATSQRMKELQADMTQPVEIFARQVATGEATLKSAKECMKAHDLLHGLGGGQLQPGIVITNWLYSTGLEESLEFIYDRQFVDNLIRHLFKEQKQARISAWHTQIARILATSHDHRDELRKAGTSLMFWHIHHADKALGLRTALNIFNHELDTQIWTADRDVNESLPMVEDSMRFRTAGNYLVSRLAPEPLKELKFGAEDSSTVDCQAYDRFSRGTRWWSSAVQTTYKQAILALHHPKNPSDAAALAQIASFRLAESRTSAPMEYVKLCIDTAKWYFERKKPDEAVKLLNEVRGCLTEEEARNVNPAGDWPALISRLNPWDRSAEYSYPRIRSVIAQNG